jgi:hypothetical protein
MVLLTVPGAPRRASQRHAFKPIANRPAPPTFAIGEHVEWKSLGMVRRGRITRVFDEEKRVEVESDGDDGRRYRLPFVELAKIYF